MCTLLDFLKGFVCTLRKICCSLSVVRFKLADTMFLRHHLAKKGSHPLLAGHSCKEMKDLGESRGDGEYWIDPGNTGQPFTVYCDMTTDGGIPKNNFLSFWIHFNFLNLAAGLYTVFQPVI